MAESPLWDAAEYIRTEHSKAPGELRQLVRRRRTCPTCRVGTIPDTSTSNTPSPLIQRLKELLLVDRVLLQMLPEEVDAITDAIAALRSAEEREASVRGAAQPFLRALEFQEERWENAKEEGEEGPLPDDLRLTGDGHVHYHPTIAQARALRRALGSAHPATE